MAAIQFDLYGQNALAANLDYLEQYESEPSPPPGDIELFGAEEDAGQATQSQTWFCTQSDNSCGSRSSLVSSGIAGNLNKAKMQASLRQRRLRAPTLLVGALRMTFGMATLFVLGDDVGPLYLVPPILTNAGIYSLLLSLLPTDRRAVPYAARSVGLFIMIALFGWSSLHSLDTIQKIFSDDCVLDDKAIPCWGLSGTASSFMAVAIASAYYVITLSFALIKRAPADVLLLKLWSMEGYMASILGVSQFVSAILFFAVGLPYRASINVAMGIVNMVFGVFTLLASSFRKRVQSWFMSRGESAVVAAGIAELLGGRQVEDVLQCARSSFSYVTADRLLFEDMKDNKPNPKLASLTERGRIGLVDAFVSHSWHDDSEKKWKRLQEFRNAFKLKHKREPKLWIDKYCIDQTNIDDSLACLPVYLAGCRKLLILCGETYLSRLWCVIEILVFLEMRGRVEYLDVRLLDELNKGPGCSSQNSSNFQKSLQDFNPRDSRCFTEYDTMRLHAVIEIFGYQRIQTLVQDVFLDSKNTSLV